MRTYRTIIVAGVPIKLYGGPGLFAKGELDKGTQLLIENIEFPSSGVVLDLACGNGIIGIYIALVRKDLKVYMSDIDARAVELAKLNARINNVDNRTVVVESDVYANLPKKMFSAIYSNPPLKAGWSVIERMICEGPEHLAGKGFMQFVFAKGWEKAVEIGKRCFSQAYTIKSKWGYKVVKYEL
jgi:16S rRNA G1207 methylase RsmC